MRCFKIIFYALLSFTCINAVEIDGYKQRFNLTGRGYWEAYNRPLFRASFIQVEELNGNYVLPYYKSFKPMYATNLVDREVKVQLSFKIPLVRVYENGIFYFGYTQRLFFQNGNFTSSSPMRDTDYQPELMFSHIFDLDVFGGVFKSATLSFRHLSNGEACGFQGRDGRILYSNNTATCGPFDRDKDAAFLQRSDVIGYKSKSSNRIVLSLVYFNDFLRIDFDTWLPFGSRFSTPNFYHYAGYADLKLSFRYKRHLLETKFYGIINNYADYKGALRASYTFKINKYVGAFFQYFYGYKDSLFEYNMLTSRLGLGFRFIR